MKRTTCIALILLLFMSISMPVQASDALLLMSAELIQEAPPEGADYEEALDVAKKEWNAFYKGAMDDPYVTSACLSLEWNGKKETVWFFAFRFLDMETPDFEVVVSCSANETLWAGEYMELERRLEWETVNQELFNFWSLEDKALYYRMYMMDLNPEAHYMSIPGDNDLTQERVLQIAKDALMDHGVSPDQIDAAKVSINFWTFINMPANEQTWNLVYYEPEHVDDANAYVYSVNLRKDGTPFHVYDLNQDGPTNG